MKICVTSKGNNIDSDIDPRFGRCRYFMVVDTDTMNFTLHPNEGAMSSGGAGIEAAQLVAKTEAKTVLTGNMGPNAFQTLSAAGIVVYTGADGTVREAIDKYKKGELTATEAPNVASHHGMGGR